MAETDSKRLTEAQAYLAMFLFLDAYWDRGKRQSIDIAGLLGDLNPFIWRGAAKSGNLPTGDPAMWPDWEEAVSRVRRGEPDPERYRLKR